MTVHIFRRGGSWWSIQTDPSGGEIRCRYPNGRAAMIALDERNRWLPGLDRFIQESWDELGAIVHGSPTYRLLFGQCPPSMAQNLTSTPERIIR